MSTGNDLVSAALRVMTSLAPGEAIPGEEADYALGVLNMMLKAWSAESLMPPCRTLESFSITAAIGSRTIGSTGQLATTRPDAVTGAFLRDSASQDYTLDVTMTKEEYNAIPLKSVSGRPRRVYFDPQYPNGVLYFDYATDVAYTLFLESLKPFNQFTTLQTTLQLPGEYEEAIKYQLVDRLAPEYGFPITPGTRLADLIDESRDKIKRKSFTQAPASYDAALTRRNAAWTVSDTIAGV